MALKRVERNIDVIEKSTPMSNKAMQKKSIVPKHVHGSGWGALSHI